MSKLPRYIVLNKKVGETPLSCVETWRQNQDSTYANLPLAYAGRLDPLASGKLLVLIGEECKKQDSYHTLDKVYEFSILFGVNSDTGDVMGRLNKPPYKQTIIAAQTIKSALTAYQGNVSLPFPVFSARTVDGKPLHTWAMEGRLNEITIPTQHSYIYRLKLDKVETKMRTAIYDQALKKINSIPPVTEERKALGNDFRRSDIRADWEVFKNQGAAADRFTIAHCTAIVSSGTYIRSLAEAIGKDLDLPALAYHIHRPMLGRYKQLPIIGGFWKNAFKLFCSLCYRQNTAIC